ncbi:hypothetical protein LOTGIDRAFT_139911 [Lottia gigantea]|uniref:G-protein coupled receptors family 1 profile domain-containing protein n=1 Tax=Lottia gigantea TaxID=225164 RepID=V4AAU0_LOTGI|nr:hypothetical protein LOTGIDRAFT_139911 [Lottia gigantea]ESP01119.1 hypothetical protein LOTGIDRAFT_139911 [Lottia gigantea]
MADLTGELTSVIRSIDPYVHLCHNLSTAIYSKRKSMTVLDFAEMFPLDVAVPVFGYASPIVILVTLILNFCVIKVLSSSKFRSPTNVMLVTIAVLDILTGCLQLPWYIHTYSLHGYRQLPDQFWCHSYYYLFRVTPIIIHTASLWCTALLAFQRYMGVSQLRRIGCVFQYKGLIGCFVTIGAGSFIIHSFALTLVKLDSVQVISNDIIKADGSLAYTNTCAISYRNADFRMYYSQYYEWTRAFLAQILPCVILGIFNLLLIRITIKGYRYRRRLVRGNKAAQNRELRTTLRMSIMLILITGSTLLAETFVAILLIIQTSQEHTEIVLADPTNVSKSMVISNFLILFTFPLNFLFYFLMSSRFRRHFVNCYIQRKHRRIVPLLGQSQNKNGNDEDDDDDEDEVDAAPQISPVQMNNFQKEENSRYNYSSQTM